MSGTDYIPTILAFCSILVRILRNPKIADMGKLENKVNNYEGSRSTGLLLW